MQTFLVSSDISKIGWGQMKAKSSSQGQNWVNFTKFFWNFEVFGIKSVISRKYC